MKIIVGSQNPVKRAAAESVLQRLYPNADFSSLSVPSRVSDQPRGDAETRQGAYNRAEAVLVAAPQAEIGIGLEGGIVETEFGMMTTAWCVVMQRDGSVGVGGGINILLPSAVAEYVNRGEELGAAMDRLTQDHNTKQKQGAIGILTDGLLDRQRAYEVIVQLAVAPFRSPSHYQVKEL